MVRFASGMRRRTVSRVLAVLALALMSWAAVADVPAVCADAQCEDSGPCSQQSQGIPHSCTTCPCQLPLLAVSTREAFPGGEKFPTVASSDPNVPANAETPAPPTPPPLSRS